MNQRRSNALLLVTLLLAVGFTPAVDAWHVMPDPKGDGTLNGPPASVDWGDDVETGSPPVDRELERVPAAVEAANGTIATTYQVLGSTLNDVEDAATGMAQLPLTLFRDGAGGPKPENPADARDGGFGEVQVVGTHPWDHRAEAAFNGQEGYGTPTNEHGTYPQHANALLVTPELDLRTHSLLEPRTDSGGTQSMALRQLYRACDTTALTGPCLAYRDILERQDMQVSLEYRMRHNLGLGNDGVSVMVFSQEPSLQDAQQCASRPVYDANNPPDSPLATVSSATQDGVGNHTPLPACRVVLPSGGYSETPVATMPGGLAYTGAAAWMRDAIDLTPWEGTSVWVGFYFTSSSILNQRYFETDSRFPDPDAGFFGFHVDDLAVKSLAAPVNLFVRPLVEPSHPVVNGVPTLHPDEPVPVHAHVVNFGATAINVTATTRILHAADRSLAATAPSVSKLLKSGEVLDVSHDVVLEMGRYIAQVCTYRSGLGAPPNGEDFCIPPNEDERVCSNENIEDAYDQAKENPQLNSVLGDNEVQDPGDRCIYPPGSCSNDPLNADPCSQVTETPFEVRPLQAIVPGPIRLGQDRLQVGDTMVVQVPVRNEGNREETFWVQGAHVDLSTLEWGQHLLPVEQRDAPVRVTLAPGEETTVEWEVKAEGKEAQYRFIAIINSTGEKQPVFDSQYDLLPEIMSPWKSEVFSGDGAIDGKLEGAWFRLLHESVGKGATVQVGNDDTHLYIGLTNLSASGLSLFFNDGGDDDIDSGSGGLGVLLEDDQPIGLRYDNGWRLDLLESSVVQVSAGVAHSLALMEDGSVYAWGSGANGRLGNGGSDDQSVPDRVNTGAQGSASGNLDDVIAVSAGSSHSLALTQGGSVFAWGDGGSGRLGNGIAPQNEPVQVLQLPAAVDVSAGGSHSLAVTEDGSVFAWGEGFFGQLGNNGNIQSAVPVQVHGGAQGSNFLEDVVGASAGVSHSLALTQDGSVYAWGTGANGELGDGGNSLRRTPVKVLAGEQGSGAYLHDIIAVAAGDSYSLAVAKDGSVYAWGSGAAGRLGNGLTTDQATPVRVLGIEDAVAVSAGGGHSLALSSDGSVHAWGTGENGRIGNGLAFDQYVAVQVGGAGSMAGASAGGSHSLGLTSEGLPLAWGSGANGRLGNGGTGDLSTPEHVRGIATFGDGGVQVGRSGKSLEMAIPIHASPGASTSGLTGGTDGLLGFAMRYCSSLVPGGSLGRSCSSFPSMVPVYDGYGFHAANGDLSDELRQWHTINLGDPAGVVGGASSYADVVAGPGFGVGTDAPPYLFQDFGGCSLLPGWTQQSPRGEWDGRKRDKWNCAPYADDGRSLLYKGLSPDSDCTGPCTPYAGDPGAPVANTGKDGSKFVQISGSTHHRVLPGYIDDESILWSPPIEIPSGASDPTLVLAHQYSTDIDIEDVLLDTSGARIRVNHALNVSLEKWVPEEGAWMDLGPLEPRGGYSTEESVGIRDFRFDRRQFYGEKIVFESAEDEELGEYRDRDCPGSLKTYNEDSTGEYAKFGGCHLDDTLRTWWWWPQGDQPKYRPPDSPLHKGGSFTGGSPWTTDVIPLHGEHFGQTLDLRESTVRLRFSFHANERADRDPDTENDWGWRIGAMAVMEGDTFTRDVSIESATLDVPYDPAEHGVGPGTTVPVRVTVRNDGALGVEGVRVKLVGEDLGAGPDVDPLLCSAEGELVGTLESGRSGNVTLPCALLPEAAGGLLALRASVSVPAEDFLGNNQQRVRGHYPVAPSPEAAVVVDASPLEAAAGIERDIQVQVQNLGNVPLDGVRVVMEVLDVSDPSRPPLRIQRQEWTAGSTLPVQGEGVPLSALMGLDEVPQFIPPKTGTYLVQVRVEVPGPNGLLASTDLVRLQASEVLYRENFNPTQSVGSKVISGPIDVPASGAWARRPNDGPDGSPHLRAGDTARGEIPVGTDATVELPPLDLATLRGATLSFQHRYDLEPGFDAARVELSTDGGQTWDPMTPLPQPLAGLPDGHPSASLVGASAILGDMVECFACAFTGSSEDLVGNEDGWVPVEYDLGRQPAFFKEAAIDVFPLEAMAPRPDAVPWSVGSQKRFLDESWVLDEPNALDNQRYWWVQNATYSEPRPLTAGRMWWSGSAGEQDPVTGEIPPVDTTLEVRAEDLGNLAQDKLILTFWDWRAGWQGQMDDDRRGTGGVYRVAVAGDEVPSAIVERRGDGWTKREVDLTSLLDGDSIGVGFRYISGSASEAQRTSISTPPDSDKRPWQGEVEDNRGWFIDSVEVIRRGPGGAEVGSFLENDGRDETGIQVTVQEGAAKWARVSQGASARDGGWHVGADAGAPAWRFAADNDQGYPHNADSRLVMPLVDLRQYKGESARIQFDHRYQFHGSMDGINDNGVTRLGRPIDGGVVTYQVLDEATGEFSGWLPLGAEAEAPELGLQFNQGFLQLVIPSQMGDKRLMGVYPASPSQEEDRTAMGYPSIAGPFSNGGSPLSLGATFATSPALLESGGKFVPFPIAHVFSGDSRNLHPDTDGWEHVDWDVSHLIGKKVRFAFHAWTNPSLEPCTILEGFELKFGAESNPCQPPMDGWTITNVALRGQQFQGEPVQIRFRVATDGSMPKGEWSIDDVLLVGQQYEKSITVQSEEPRILDVPGTEVTFEGAVRNLGSSPRTGLALVVEAVHAATGDPVPLEIHPVLDQIPVDQLPSSAPVALGPFDLGSGGSLPLRVTLDVPDGEALVRVQVLEDVGECDPSGACSARYAPVRNEQGAGVAAATWTAIGEDRTDLRLVPPRQDRQALVVADPPVPAEDQEVSLEATLRNNGTTTPDVVAQWTVVEVLRKGCPQGKTCPSQPHTRESLGQEWAEDPVELDLPPGASTPLQLRFTPPSEGLYRARLEIRDSDSVLDQTTFEFMAGEVEPYYLIDFAKTTADGGGWAAVAASPGQDPPTVAFRQIDGQFLWGVTPLEFLNGKDYCTDGGCNPSGTNGGPPVFGLHAIAQDQGPPIDLGLVTGDQAVLALRHGHGFASGDGAVVEALPLRSPVSSNPRAAFSCVDATDGSRTDAWFRLAPLDEADLRGELRNYPAVIAPGRPPPVIPARQNALGLEGSVIGGGTDGEVTRFLLDGALAPVCPVGDGVSWELEGNAPSSLVNYTLLLRLRVGTLPSITDSNCNVQGSPGCPDNPNPRPGALGWQVDSIGITSVDVQLGPDGRELPLRDGFAKRFNLLLENRGPLEETFHVGLGPRQEFRADPAWFTFPVPEVTLAPGESRVVPFEVNVPAEPRVERGRYTANLRVTSSLDPSLSSQALVELHLEENLLPDLAAGLNIQAETRGEPPEPGKLAHVVTTVHNDGRAASERVPVRVEAVRLNETGAEVGRSTVGAFDLPALKPDEGATRFLEWVPRSPGTYRIEAVADPEGRLVEGRLDNSRATALVEVVPLQRPDVRVAKLTFEGVGEDGYALEGGLVTIVANVTNRGNVAATGAQVFILADSAQLLEVTLDSLAPGAYREVTALRVASPGEAMVRALVIPGFGAGNQGDSEHELRRVLRVRGIDLAFEAESGPLSLEPGGTGTTRIDVDNTGNAVEKVVFSLDSAHEGWGIAATPNPVTVAPGQAAWSILTLQAPPDAVAGTYNITVLAEPQSHPGTRQPVAVAVDVSQRLEAPLITLANATAPPGPAALPLTLQSRANVPQDVVLVLAEPDWSVPPHAVTLAAGKRSLVDLPVTVPAHAPPGEVPVRVAVQDDAGTVLAEAAGFLNVTAHAAGSAQWSGRPTVAEGNLTARVFQMTLNVSNDGNVPIEVEALLGRLSEGVDGTAGAPVEVAPGASVDLPVAVRVSPEFTQRVEGRVDVLMRTNHSDSGPTVQRIAVLDLPGLGTLPDLAITDVAVTPRGTVAANKPVQVTITVENLGFADSPPTDLYGFVDGEAVGAYAIEPLAQGGSVRVNLTWAFPRSGGYIVHLVADGSGNLTELHDDNNGWTQQVDVEADDLVQRAREVPAAPVLPLLLLCLAMALGRRRRA